MADDRTYVDFAKTDKVKAYFSSRPLDKDDVVYKVTLSNAWFGLIWLMISIIQIPVLIVLIFIFGFLWAVVLSTVSILVIAYFLLYLMPLRVERQDQM